MKRNPYFFTLFVSVLALGFIMSGLSLTCVWSQDEAATPAEDAAAEDATAEDATAEDATAEDAEAEDATAEDAATEDAPAEDSKAEDATAEDAVTEDSKAEAEDSKAAADEKKALQAALSQEGAKAGDELSVTLGGVKYTFRWCPAGTFMMGAPSTEVGYTHVERQHEVKLTKGFWMLETEVTQEMYLSLMGENPSYFAETGFGRDEIKENKDGNEQFADTSQFPVDRVMFEDAENFCKAFSEKAGVFVHLPTEAQWEYACRAGTTTKYYCGDSIKRTDANYNIVGKEGSLGRTSPVGKFGKNAWGLCDMMGNVNEWCTDWYDPNYYRAGAKKAETILDEEEDEEEPVDLVIAPVTDPTGPVKGVNRVVRGGSWLSQPFYCRSACRNYLNANYHYGHYYDGFRFLCIPGEEAAVEAAVEEKADETIDSAAAKADVEAEAKNESPAEATAEEKVDLAEDKVEEASKEGTEAVTEEVVEDAKEELEEKKTEEETAEEETAE